MTNPTTNPFHNMLSGMARDIAAAGAKFKRRKLQEQFPGASDEVLDRIIDLDRDLEAALFRQSHLVQECDDLRGKAGMWRTCRASSDDEDEGVDGEDFEEAALSFKEIKRRTALAELRLLELKIKKMEGTV